MVYICRFTEPESNQKDKRYPLIEIETHALNQRGPLQCWKPFKIYLSFELHIQSVDEIPYLTLSILSKSHELAAEIFQCAE